MGLLNPFVPNTPFLYPLETSENLRFSDVFRGKRKSALGTNRLIHYAVRPKRNKRNTNPPVVTGICGPQ